MTKRATQKAMVEAVGSVIAEKAPELAAVGLENLADKQDDDLAKGVLRIMAGFVRTHGEGAISTAAQNVQALIDGDPLAVARLVSEGADAEALTLLTYRLQTAEAERKKNASKMAAHVGAAMADLAKFLGLAAKAALTK